MLPARGFPLDREVRIIIVSSSPFVSAMTFAGAAGVLLGSVCSILGPARRDKRVAFRNPSEL